ncbi:helix-turn-helix domain-containing protein [Lactococcus lactis]|uniref:helix-turn-helix domain-containing protein n=1 Tax=Lactococcus lactis TaxID=1358 RepID=UPI0009BCE42C|nr:helix-turn-helix domain-containing protein [Lactococcus lactis]
MVKNDLFFNRLDQLMTQSGKTYNQVERELNYPRNALNNYKHGSEPSATRLFELSDYFNISPYYFIGKSEQLSPQSMKELFETLDLNQRLELSKLSTEWLLSKVESEKNSLDICSKRRDKNRSNLAKSLRLDV